MIGVDQMARRREYRSRTLERGIAVLRCFGADSPELSLTEIVGRTGMPKATVFRILCTLCEAGMVVHDETHRRYRVGACALDLGTAFLQALRLPSIAAPYLERLAVECMESASAAILDGAQVVYVARAATRRWMSVNLQVGSRLPAYCTSMGRAMLAYRPWREVRALLARTTLVAYTPKTVTDLSRLAEILHAVRTHGYAVNDEELEIGLRSAAAPVLAGLDRALAALNVSAPSSRVSLEMLVEEFVPRLLQATREISDVLRRAAEAGADLDNPGTLPVARPR
ncbi:MAG: helix-turn-helix domain-containing protein [Armatimonadetes bacterium]|nr:helix-turn-helix domain-containing protein [Armatimonadota bacterium]